MNNFDHRIWTAQIEKMNSIFAFSIRSVRGFVAALLGWSRGDLSVGYCTMRPNRVSISKIVRAGCLLYQVLLSTIMSHTQGSQAYMTSNFGNKPSISSQHHSEKVYGLHSPSFQRCLVRQEGHFKDQQKTLPPRRFCATLVVQKLELNMSWSPIGEREWSLIFHPVCQK